MGASRVKVVMASFAGRTPSLRLSMTALTSAPTSHVVKALIDQSAPSEGGPAPTPAHESAMALRSFTIRILGDVPSPSIIGAMSDARNLAVGEIVTLAAVPPGGLIGACPVRSRRPTAGAPLEAARGVSR